MAGATSYELPDWLREPADSEPNTDQHAAEARREVLSSEPEMSVPPSTEPDLPAWLRASSDQPGAPALPGGSAGAPAPAGSTSEIKPSAIPSWLLAEDDSVPSSQQPPAPNALPDNVQPWNVDYEDEASINEAPSSRNAVSFRVPQPMGSRPIETGDLPGWLRMDEGDTQDETNSSDPAIPAEAPAWLRDDTMAASNPTADDLPSWLHDAQETTNQTGETTADQQAAPQSPAVVDNSTPAWLAEAQSPVQDTTSTGASPSWLADNDEESPLFSTTPEANDTVAERPPLNPQAELPSWLQAEPSAASTTADGTTEEPAPSGAVADDTLPDWLRASAFDPPTFEPPSPAAWLTDTAPESPAPRAADLPSWLHQPEHEAGSVAETDDSSHVARTYEVDAPSALPEDSQATVAESDVPSWLVGLQPTTATPSTGLPSWLNDINAPPSATFDEEVETSAISEADAQTGGLPPWLEGLETPVAAPSQPDPTQQRLREDARADSDLAAQLDLPAWLREPNVDAAATAEPASTPSWLQDIGHDEPTRTDESTVVAPVARPALERSAERREAMQLLERILLEPAPEPVAPPEPVQTRRRFPIIPLLAFLILIAIIIAILLNNRLPLGLGATPPVAPGVEALAARVATINTQSPVLVAYEMDARRAAELGALEENVLEPLLARRVPLLLMTTDPQGALFARRRAGLLDTRRDGFYGQAGQGSVDLGFQPGGGVALARMSTNFGSVLAQDWTGQHLAPEHPILTMVCGSPVSDGITCQPEELGMIVVLADEAEDVRLWVEQVASRYPTLPMTFAVPAELEPVVQPYLTRPELAMVSGLDGAIALQQSRDLHGPPVDDWLARRADATTVGRAAFGAMVIIGAIPALWSGRRARE